MTEIVQKDIKSSILIILETDISLKSKFSKISRFLLETCKNNFIDRSAQKIFKEVFRIHCYKLKKIQLFIDENKRIQLQRF